MTVRGGLILFIYLLLFWGGQRGGGMLAGKLGVIFRFIYISFEKGETLTPTHTYTRTHARK